MIISLIINGHSSAGVKIGSYTPEERQLRITKFLEKRTKRIWTKKVKYDIRKNFADSRLRVKVSYFHFDCFFVFFQYHGF